MESLFQQGYGSDGERTPYLMENNKDLDELEDACDVMIGSEESINDNSPKTTENATDGVFEFIAEEDLKRMKVDDLCNELKKCGLNTKGLKNELQTCLCQRISDCVPNIPEQTSEVPAQADVL